MNRLDVMTEIEDARFVAKCAVSHFKEFLEDVIKLNKEQDETFEETLNDVLEEACSEILSENNSKMKAMVNILLRK